MEQDVLVVLQFLGKDIIFDVFRLLWKRVFFHEVSVSSKKPVHIAARTPNFHRKNLSVNNGGF